MSTVTTEHPSSTNIQRLKAPPAAAIAGILFAILFAASISLIRINIPADLSGAASWSKSSYGPLQLALVLMPFAVIAFLWFVAVIRDRLGEQEDQFFATVFFGSSLLFLAMVCVSMAIAGGILVVANSAADENLKPGRDYVWRAVMLQISNVYALRMAAIFMISIATIWLRARVSCHGGWSLPPTSWRCCCCWFLQLQPVGDADFPCLGLLYQRVDPGHQ